MINMAQNLQYNVRYKFVEYLFQFREYLFQFR